MQPRHVNKLVADMTPEELEVNRAYFREVQRRFRSGNGSPRVDYIPQYIVDDAAWREATPPRDLTATLMDDPLPGYLALDRR